MGKGWRRTKGKPFSFLPEKLQCKRQPQSNIFLFNIHLKGKVHELFWSDFYHLEAKSTGTRCGRTLQLHSKDRALLFKRHCNKGRVTTWFVQVFSYFIISIMWLTHFGLSENQEDIWCFNYPLSVWNVSHFSFITLMTC